MLTKTITGTNKNRILNAGLYIIFLFLFAGSVFSMGTYDLLRIDPTPQGSALGGHAVAMPDQGLGTLSSNPAGLAYLENRSTMFIYGDHQLDMYSGHIAYGQELYGHYWIGSITYFSYGEFDRYESEFGTSTGNFTAGDYLISLGTAQKLPVEGMSIGAGVKYIHSKIDEYSSSGMGIDLGYRWDVGFEDVIIGVNLKNVGFQLSKYSDVSEKFPVMMHLGVSKGLAHLPLRLSLNLHSEAEQVFDSIVPDEMDNVYATFCGKLKISPQLFLMGGYTTRGVDYRVGSSDDNIAGISAGLGIELDKIAVNYSAHALGAVGQVHRIGVAMNF